jgi:hypothetical protein
VLAAIDKGLPHLRALADGADEIAEVEALVAKAMPLVPSEAA